MKNTWKFLLCLSFVTLCVSLSFGQKLKPEEIIAKHLDSIGKKETRDAVKNRMAVGFSEFQSKLPTVTGVGKVVVVSDMDNLYFLMSINSKEYPFEKVGYFTDKLSLPFTTGGSRSPLGAFIADHQRILSDGLLTGSMSARWAMLDPARKKAKLVASGTKKVNGRNAYVIEYFPSDGGSSEFTIKLFFDAENFRHIRSEYFDDIPSKQDTFGTLGRQAGVKLALTEDFSDFKTVDGLTLPHNYKVDFASDSNSGTFEYVWGVKISEYYYNQKLAPDFFTFDVK